MPEFSEAEKQLLIGVRSIMLRRESPDKSALENFGKRFFDDDLVDWTEAYESLMAKGHLQFNNSLYSLSDEATKLAAEFYKKRMSSGFDEWMIRSCESKAYSRFCELVYGIDLCQCSMVDGEQLDKLMEVLALTPANRVLDLGCGVGRITEYLSDKTGAKITGVDFAEGVVDRANKRTAMKRDRLSFCVCDMNELNFPSNSFDTIIAIDTLYFVDDLDETVGAMKNIIGDAGQMGVFYSQIIKPDDSRDLLDADSTKFAKALHNSALSYRTWCFTENEYEIWRKEKKIAEELKADFESDGYMDLCEGRAKEAEHLLELIKDGRVSRHLYHIKARCPAIHGK
ncbi:MAG: methyltransferase domain-containing protein [candidate division Zixibacteria bacterium]|nr:methyltransferase domain-containing protein [candidate division Zixibacteria bacterium]